MSKIPPKVHIIRDGKEIDLMVHELISGCFEEVSELLLEADLKFTEHVQFWKEDTIEDFDLIKVKRFKEATDKVRFLIQESIRILKEEI